MPLPALIGAGLLLGRGALTASTIAPLVKPALGFAKRFLQKATARPGIGSKVTKGPLKLGKQTLYGPARPGTGVVLKAAGAAAVGVGAVASHRSTSRSSSRPQTAPSARRARSSSTPTRTGERKCCPAGTKRMVCYKKGRVKARLGSKASKWRRKPKRTAKRKRRTTKRRRK